MRWNTDTQTYKRDSLFPEELQGQITQVNETETGLEAVNADGEVLATAAGENAEWIMVEQFAEVTNIARVNELLPKVEEGQYLTVVDESQVPGFIALWMSPTYLEGKEIADLVIRENLQEGIDFLLEHANAHGLTAVNAQTGKFEYFPVPDNDVLVERIVSVQSDIPWSLSVVDDNGIELPAPDPVKSFDLTEGFSDAIVFDPISRSVIVYAFTLAEGMEIWTKTQNKPETHSLARGSSTTTRLAIILLSQSEVLDSVASNRVITTETFNKNDAVQRYLDIVKTREWIEDETALLFTFEENLE